MFIYLSILNLFFFFQMSRLSLSVFQLSYWNLAKLYIWHHFTPWQIFLNFYIIACFRNFSAIDFQIIWILVHFMTRIAKKNQSRHRASYLWYKFPIWTVGFWRVLLNFTQAAAIILSPESNPESRATILNVFTFSEIYVNDIQVMF